MIPIDWYWQHDLPTGLKFEMHNQRQQQAVDNMLRAYHRRTKAVIKGTVTDAAAVAAPLVRDPSWFRIGAVLCVYNMMCTHFSA